MSDSGFRPWIGGLISHLPMRAKLVVFFLLISLLSVTAVAIVVNHQTRRILVEAVEADLRGLANNESIAAGNLLLHQVDLLESRWLLCSYQFR